MMHAKLTVLNKLWKEMTKEERESKVGKYFRAALESAVFLLEKNGKMEAELREFRRSQFCSK